MLNSLKVKVQSSISKLLFLSRYTFLDPFLLLLTAQMIIPNKYNNFDIQLLLLQIDKFSTNWFSKSKCILNFG